MHSCLYLGKVSLSRWMCGEVAIGESMGTDSGVTKVGCWSFTHRFTDPSYLGCCVPCCVNTREFYYLQETLNEMSL